MKKLLTIVLTLIVLTLAITSCGAKAVTGITIDEGLVREYNLNATPDFSGVKATVKYNDESTKSVTADDLTFGELDTSTAGTKQLTITYGGFSITVDVVVRGATTNTKTITSITVTEGIESSYEIGSTPDFSGIKATVSYNDGTTVNVTAEDLTIGTVDTATQGVKKLSITYDGFTATVNVTVVAPAGVMSIVVTEGLLPEYEYGSTPDFTGIKVTVTYTDGTTVEVDYDDLTIGTIDTTAPGTQDLTIEYDGFIAYIDVVVAEEVYPFEITGADLPTFITNRNEYMKSFKQQGKTYVVGDDNAFTLALIITAFDLDDNLVKGLDYIGTTLVYLITDDGEQIVGTDYVTVDELAHTFDFTEAAIGKTFRIVTRPTEGIEDDMIDDVTAQLTVTIVDGYNITNAKELNLITNYADDMNDDDADGDEQLKVVNTFLKNNGIVRPENLKSVVIHGNIVITTNDLPDGYFVTYTKDGVTKKEFYDFASIYNRCLTPDEPTFAIHGNYYTIYSYELPCTVAYGYGNQNDDYSNSELFMFQFDEEMITDGMDLSGYGATVNDLGIVDSHPNSNNENESERSMRGLTGIKVHYTKLDVTNTNIEKFFISINAAFDYTTLNLDSVNLYNAWMGHIFAWSDNSSVQGQHETPWASYKPVYINIKNSSLTKCGGPVILAQNNVLTDWECNDQCAVITTVDEASVLESWVTGEEAWFTATGVKPLAIQIKQLSQLLTITGANYGKTASFVKVDGNQTYLNLVYVNMSTGLPGAGAPEIDGKLTIGDKVVLNQNDGENDIIDNYANTVGQAMGATPPVFQSSAGGTCFGNPGPEGAGTYNVDFAKLMAALQSGVDAQTAFMSALGIASPECFQGEYITIYYNGMAILLEYMN